ncbi:unnamed protein product [Tenebrio molitor]|nr:unnamed protein product [Tenebrio molitor]
MGSSCTLYTLYRQAHKYYCSCTLVRFKLLKFSELWSKILRTDVLGSDRILQLIEAFVFYC